MRGQDQGRAFINHRNPKISANNNGFIVAVFDDHSGYSVGRVCLKNESLPIEWLHSKMEKLEGFSSPDVSIVDTKVIVVARKETSLYCVIGQLNEDEKIVEWAQMVDTRHEGSFPSISLNNNGRVLLCYQSPIRKIIIVSGVTPDSCVTWENEFKTSGQLRGEYPTITFGDDLIFIIAYKAFLGLKLKIRPGYLPLPSQIDNTPRIEQEN